MRLARKAIATEVPKFEFWNLAFVLIIFLMVTAIKCAIAGEAGRACVFGFISGAGIAGYVANYLLKLRKYAQDATQSALTQTQAAVADIQRAFYQVKVLNDNLVKENAALALNNAHLLEQNLNLLVWKK